MNLFVTGMSYRTAPVMVREQLAVAKSQLAREGGRLKASGGLEEVVLLSTCNRVEIYGAASGPRNDKEALLELLAPAS